MTGKLKANGKRGSWFAEIDGVSYPCVHKFWVRNGKAMVYSDPIHDHSDRHWPEFITALRAQKKAILTNDETPDGGFSFTRTGYIALYEIADIEMDTTLRFRFVRRLAECR